MSPKESGEEFEPFCKWEKEGRDDVLKVYLSGFKKDGLKVHVCRQLTVRGKRTLDKHTTQSFKRTFKVPKGCKIDEIEAKFTGGILSIKFPANRKDSGKSILQWCSSEMAWKYVERIVTVGCALCVFKCCLCSKA